MQSLTPDDVATAANTYLTDSNLVLTTLAQQKLPDGIARIPPLASFAPGDTALGAKRFIIQKNEMPQLRVKLLFDVGSAHDPAGKEGLARLAATMISEAGSKDMQINEINKALYPLAGGAPRPLPGVEVGDFVNGFSADGTAVFATAGFGVPARVYRVEIATGKRSRLLELAPPDRAGILTIPDVELAKDGATYAYSYHEIRSQLFLVSGLR